MKRFDAIIIGGGLTGCASAYYLARRGVRVALLERRQVNAGASGQNAGSLHFQLEHRLIQHADELGEELDFNVALALQGIADWRGLEAELDAELELAMHGGIMVAENEQQLATLEKKAEVEQRQGLGVELIDGHEARRLAPFLSDTIVAGLLCRDEGHCNPRLLSWAFARRARELGATFLLDTRVTTLQGPGQRQGHPKTWQVGAEGPDGEPLDLAADIVVNTAGVWASEIGRLANVHLPLFPVGLTINVTERIAPSINYLIQHVGRRLSLKQVDDGNLLIGGGWPSRLQQSNGQWTLELSALLNRDAVRGNLQAACDVAPGIAGLHIIRSWTGTTAVTPDQVPLIGAVSQAPGFYVAAGGNGFTYGPTYARLLAELITEGRTEFPLAPYSPDRFAHMNAFMGSAAS